MSKQYRLKWAVRRANESNSKVAKFEKEKTETKLQWEAALILPPKKKRCRLSWIGIEF